MNPWSRRRGTVRRFSLLLLLVAPLSDPLPRIARGAGEEVSGTVRAGQAEIPAAVPDRVPPGASLRAPEKTARQGMAKSPIGAMFRSAALPGWGQFYTDHPRRGGLIFTAEGLLLSLAWEENRRAGREWDIYKATEDPRYLESYDRHFGRARDMASLAITVFLLNMADAYVSAHLYDFDSRIRFSRQEDQLGLSLRLGRGR